MKESRKQLETTYWRQWGQIWDFFIKTKTGTAKGKERKIKSTLGELKLRKKQLSKLGMADRSRISPLLDKCLMRVCASAGYQSAERDIKALMGLEVGHSSLHRYVQKQELEMPAILDTIESSSIDGGKIRMRGAKGEKSYYRDYKIARLNSQWYGAAYLDNERLIDWINSHKQAVPLVCRGDGHDGVWNIFAEIGTERMEILDWYHLKEHLFGVGGSLKRLKIAESLLWEGNVTDTIPLFKDLKKLKAVNFIKYLEKHQERIVNYHYWTNIALQPIAVGSGDVESAVKQMGMRVKLSGARWAPANVNQILSLRCAYLNGVFDIT